MVPSWGSDLKKQDLEGAPPASSLFGEVGKPVRHGSSVASVCHQGLCLGSVPAQLSASWPSTSSHQCELSLPTMPPPTLVGSQAALINTGSNLERKGLFHLTISGNHVLLREVEGETQTGAEGEILEEVS